MRGRNPIDQLGRTGKGLDVGPQGGASEHRKEELYRSVRGSVGSMREKQNSSELWHFSELLGKTPLGMAHERA